MNSCIDSALNCPDTEEGASVGKEKQQNWMEQAEKRLELLKLEVDKELGDEEEDEWDDDDDFNNFSDDDEDSS